MQLYIKTVHGIIATLPAPKMTRHDAIAPGITAF